MKKNDLRRALVGIAISQMEQYDNEPFNIIHGERLYKALKKDIEKMFDSWWKPHFPMFHYTISVQVHTAKEPTVLINWTSDGNINEEWDRLTFLFKPVRLANDYDPLKAYERAMAII